MKSKWITIRDVPRKNMHAQFEKLFKLSEVKNTIIDITADDYYKLYVNGNFVGQGPAPSYDFDYAYNRYNITQYLKEGKNFIKIIAYYQGLVNRVWVSGDGKFGVVADIYIDGEYAFGTNEKWKYKILNSYVTTGSKNDIVGYKTAYLEHRDLSKKDSKARYAKRLRAKYTLEKEPFPSLEVYKKEFTPIDFDGKKSYYDFGEEYVCTLTLYTHSENGGRFILRSAEELDENGKPRFDLRANCRYEEFISQKDALGILETYEYKAMRYLEVESDGASVMGLMANIQHFPFPENSWEYKTDNADLKAVFDLCKNTIKYGTQEGFIDCPTREKGQYIGDTFISGFAHLYLTNDNRLLKRAIKSFSNSIQYSGKMLAVSNCAYQQEFADYSLLYPVMVLKYYNCTKDKEFLSEMLPACDFVLNYFAKFENEDMLLENATEQENLVDWPDNLRDDYEFADVHNVINAFYYASVKALEDIKSELGIEFEVKANIIKDSFNRYFLKDGLYVDNKESSHSSVHSNMLPLAFGITNDESIANYLVERGMQCGTYMSYFYLKALCNANKKDEAINAITSKGKHGWLNMISEGATRTYEAWGKDEKWNTSLFHPWSTAPLLILYEEFNDQ